MRRCKKVLYNPDRDNGSIRNICPEEPGETLGWLLGCGNRGYGGFKGCYTPTEKEILATNKGIWASSEVVGTEAQVIFASQFSGVSWAFKERVPSRHHANDAACSKWAALIIRSDWKSWVPGKCGYDHGLAREHVLMYLGLVTLKNMTTMGRWIRLLELKWLW